MLKLAGLEQRPDGRFFSSPEDEPDTDSHSYLLHIWTSPSAMWLFFIVISCCCMRVSGRVFTDDAVVIAHLRWAPTLLAHAGGGKVPAGQMPPAVLCGPEGEGGAQQWGWGLNSCFSCSALWSSGHVSHTVFPRNQLPLWKVPSIPKNADVKESSTHYNCSWFFSLCHYEAYPYLFHPFPWAHPNTWLSASHTFMPDRPTLHLL